MIKPAITALAVAALLMSGCSDSAPVTETKKEAPKKPAVPTGPISALTAYYDVYKLARQLAPDLQVASIAADDIENNKGENGKYSQWKIVFVSSTQRKATSFIYTTDPHGSLLKGINNTGSIPWAGPTRDAMPFSNSDFSVDSDAAYNAAAEKAGDWLKKNASKPVTTFALGHASHFPAPMWYIMWGDKKTGGYAVYVNASTGKVFGK